LSTTTFKTERLTGAKKPSGTSRPQRKPIKCKMSVADIVSVAFEISVLESLRGTDDSEKLTARQKARHKSMIDEMIDEKIALLDARGLKIVRGLNWCKSREELRPSKEELTR